ncbi:MAG: sugar ABC transporter permease, partial [Pseudomonadota bacterium]
MRKAFPYLLVAPAVLYLLMITLYPGVYAIYQSLFLVRFNSWTFVGTENYVDLFGDREFWAALWNTFVIGSISLALQC